MIGLQFSDLRLQFSDGVAKLGTRQMPFFRRFSQSSPSWSSLFTPMESIIRPFLVGRERFSSGSGWCEVVGAWLGGGAGIGVIDGVVLVVVDARVEASA